MIISDLNYLEVVSSETTVVGGFTYPSVKFNEKVDIYKDVYSKVDVYGHIATSESDATASGKGTLAETFTNTDTTSYGSSSSGTSISATSGSYYKW